jgi:hypothetical protein
MSANNVEDLCRSIFVGLVQDGRTMRNVNVRGQLPSKSEYCYGGEHVYRSNSGGI